MPRRTTPWGHRSGAFAIATVLAVAGFAPAARASGAPEAAASEAAVPVASAATTPTQTPSLVDGLAVPVDASIPADQAAHSYLAAHRDQYAIADPTRDLATNSVNVAPDGTTTVRLDQRYHGVPVFGAQYVVRLAKHGASRTVAGTSGSYFSELTVDTTPRGLPAATAVQRAVTAVQRSLAGPAPRVIADAPGHRAATLTGVDHGLVVLPTGSGVLTRHVTVHGSDPATGAPVMQEVYLDVRTGSPLLAYSGIETFAAPGERASSAQATVATPGAGSSRTAGSPTATSVQGDVLGSGTTLHGATVPLHLTQTADGGYAFEDHASQAAQGGGVISTWDAGGLYSENVSGVWPDGLTEFASPTTKAGGTLTDVGAVDAHWDAAQVYNWYAAQLGRTSLDGKGMAIRSIVGVTYYGSPFVNAFWDSVNEKMVYGTGDAEYMPLAADLDVVGHEMTHGVVQHTADLVYLGQSGALNEAVADYFGNAIDVTVSHTQMADPNAGLIGGDLCRTRAPKDCAFRDLNDGRTTASFLSMPAEYAYDAGGVHLNSTIFSGALWDIREKLGGTLADHIVYHALSDFWTPLTDFSGAADSVVAAAKDLGVNGSRLKAVKDAFAAHGITDRWEKTVLGSDATVLLGNVPSTQINYGYGITPSAAGGWWAATRSNADGSAPLSVWVGRTDGKGTPRQVSPADGRIAASPWTDGTKVVWLQITPDSWADDGTYLPGQTQIMSARVAGGPSQVLWTTSQQVSGLSADGDVVAWSEPGPNYLPVVYYLRGNATTPQTIAAPLGTGMVMAPVVKNGHIAYIDEQWTAESWSLGVDMFDLATGQTSYGWQAPEAEWEGVPTITATGAYWVVDANWAVEENTIGHLGFDGATGSLIPEGTGHGVRAEMVTASDTTLTIMEDPTSADYYGGISDKMLPKLQQFTLAGVRLGRVSCAPGAELLPAAVTGRTVVWIDSRTSLNDLVVGSGSRKANCS
ncbi:M4 family metallopeptidase [Hamadaea tsunoensis]|uniref:M4 family metallopeptidase n=1 Tax=Hamadaea tsunoensis TaxID=53368 RepID=UPI0003FAC4C3|nr:M4 family metallopeptidase [Hamadaea tsunoensis]